MRQNALASHVLGAKLWDQGPIIAQKGSWSTLVFDHSRTFYELSGGGCHWLPCIVCEVASVWRPVERLLGFQWPNEPGCKVSGSLSSLRAGGWRMASSQGHDPPRPRTGHFDVGLARAPASLVAGDQLSGLASRWSTPQGLGGRCPDRLGLGAPRVRSLQGALPMKGSTGNVRLGNCTPRPAGERAGRATTQSSLCPPESPSACQTSDSGPFLQSYRSHLRTHPTPWSAQSTEPTRDMPHRVTFKLVTLR